MPTSVIMAAVGGLVSGSTIIGGLSLGFSWGAFASSLVMSGLSAALRPDKPSQQQQQQESSISSGGRTVTVRQAITPWRVIYGKDRVGGAITYKKVTDSNRNYHMVITLAGHVSQEIVEVWFGDEVVTLDGSGNGTGKWAGYVRIKKSLGAEAGQPFPDLVTESGGEWTDAHRQTGHTKIYVRVTASNEIFPNGLPNITAVVKGKKDIYDPRFATTGWTDNPALCIANYLCDTRIGRGAIYADEINEADLIASANVCDESVTLAAGGTEKRYTLNGSFSTSEKPVDIIGKMASAFAGHVVQIGAQWNVLAGAYLAPTITLTADDLAGPLQWQSMVSRRDNCNGVKGIFSAPANNYQATDFPAVTSATYLAQDNGEAAWHDLELNYTNSGTMAQRIAKIELLRTRQGLTVTWPGNLSCYRAQPGKTVMITLAKYGWSAKPFFVVGGTFRVGSDGALGYTLDLRETAAAVFDWSTSEEQTVDIAPNTDLGDVFTVSTPTGLTLSSGTTELLRGGDGTIISRIKVVWTTPTDAFVTAGGEALVQFKKTADADWMDLPPIPDGTGPCWIDSVQDGVSYDVRLRYRNALGIRGTPCATVAHTVVGKTAAPSNVSSLTATISADRVVLTWPEITDADADLYEVRQGASWAAGSLVGSVRATALKIIAPSAGSYTWWVKAVDTSGNYSATAASAALTIAAPAQPTVTATLSAENVVITWVPGAASFPIAQYELRYGASFAAGTSLGFITGTTWRGKVNWSGSRSFWVAATDVAGNVSTAGMTSVTITVAPMPTITFQVVDNNVLLSWTGSAGSLPIDTYEIRRGATWAGGTVIGTKSGGFTTVFETVGGVYTYWVAAIDSAGNYGTPGSVAATVNAPPDYVLYLNQYSAFGGTKTNAIIDGGMLLAPVNTADTWAQHFTNNAWTTPQDQINAGYPIYIQPTPSTASYVETIDYGTTLAATKITVTPATNAISGSITQTPTIETSPDNATWTTYAGVWSVYATAFRYVRVTIAFSGGGTALAQLATLNYRLDIKLHTITGQVTCNSADTGGTTVYLTSDRTISGTKEFIDVDAISITPQGTTAVTALYDFTDAPNPLSMKVLLFNSVTGARVSGTASYVVRGA